MPRRTNTAPRSPYWVIGMESNEPWVALAQTNVGLVIVPCNRNAEHAHDVAGKWRSLTRQGLPIKPHTWAVGASVIDPRGAITGQWGDAPRAGGTSRWVPLMMLQRPELVTCLECHGRRWQGCWMALDMHGCSRCLPTQEVHDPRRWPEEPPQPNAAGVPDRRKTPARPRSSAGRPAGAARRQVVDSPEQTRIA